MLVQQEIQRSGFEDLITSGVVLTGGGSVMEGMVELAEEVLGLPARIGQPESVGGLVDVVRNPKYSSGVGLVLYGFNHQPLGRDLRTNKNPFWKILDRTRGWLSDVF